MAVNRLDWDSDFFGFEIGEYVLGDELTQTERYELVYVKGNIDFTIEISGFVPTYSETKLVFQKHLNQIREESTSKITDSVADFSIDTLYQLAFESGKHSRFNKDPNIKDSDFKRLYRQWIDSSLRKEFADGFLFYIDRGTLCGFVTYKISDGFATIGLIAVSPEMQGLGIGRKLLTYVENLLLEIEISELRIPTQSTNISACNFYTKMGYTVLESTCIKHYWTKNNN